MSTLHTQRRVDDLGGAGERHTTSHKPVPHKKKQQPATTPPASSSPSPKSSSNANSDRTRATLSASSVANLAALVPPSMRTRTTPKERRKSESPESTTPSSRLHQPNSAVLSDVSKSSSRSSSEEPNTFAPHISGTSLQPSPCTSSPLLEGRRCGSSLSDVSVSTVEEEHRSDSRCTAGRTPPSVSVTQGSRTITASDYAPLTDVPQAVDVPSSPHQAQSSPTTVPRPARPRFGLDHAAASTATHPPLPKPSEETPANEGEEKTVESTQELSEVSASAAAGAAAVCAAPSERLPWPKMPTPPPMVPRPTRDAPPDAAPPIQGHSPPQDTAEVQRREPLRSASASSGEGASRTSSADGGGVGGRARSARRPTQSVQTARARAQQRRTASSASPHARGTPVAPSADAFPGAKRLEDNRVPLSIKLYIGTACLVGVGVVAYLGCSLYRYAAAAVTAAETTQAGPPTAPVTHSRFPRACAPKKVEVSDKEAARIARDIRDRITANMQNAVN